VFDRSADTGSRPGSCNLFDPHPPPPPTQPPHPSPDTVPLASSNPLNTPHHPPRYTSSASHVVSQQCKHVGEQHGLQRGAVLDHHKCVQGVLMGVGCVCVWVCGLTKHVGWHARAVFSRVEFLSSSHPTPTPTPTHLMQAGALPPRQEVGDRHHDKHHEH